MLNTSTGAPFGSNASEGGTPDQPTGASAQPPRVLIDPEQLYYHGKRSHASWLSALGLVSPGLRADAEHRLQHTEELSSRDIATMFRSISNTIWTQNWWASLWGLSSAYDQIPVQKEFNNRLWTHNDDGTLDHITSDDLAPLFNSKNPRDWPNIVFTSNHARAWRSEDLTELMKGVERLAQDSGGKPLDLYRLRHDAAIHGQRAPAAGKTIMVLACSTERDMYRNGARLLDRRHDLRDDPNKENPAQRTRDHLSPAAIRLAKLMMKLMVEPQCRRLINLDCANIDIDDKLKERPFIADHFMRMGTEDIDFPEKNPIILRADAASIAQHLKGIGYSLGANTVTDAVRFFYQECRALNGHLKTPDRHGGLRPVTEADIATIISNIGLMNIAPGEVPLTEAERKVGMNRATILNTNDMTAGHLVNPRTEEYDRWQDRLMKIEGGKGESGHSIHESLGIPGADGKCGFIMDPANRDRPGYRAAQDAVRAFFASNFHKHAVTNLEFWHHDAARQNGLSIQFAPGTARAEEHKIEAELLEQLHAHGFAQATAESDLSHRRLVTIMLEPEADMPVAGSRAKLAQCKAAFEAVAAAEHGNLFIASDAMGHIEELWANAPEKPVLGTHTQAWAANGKGNGHSRNGAKPRAPCAPKDGPKNATTHPPAPDSPSGAAR